MQKTAERMPHSIILQQRERLSLSGVRAVSAYDANCVKLLTDEGKLTVRGEGLSMGALDTETGEMKLAGRIRSLEYSSGSAGRKGVRERLFG